MNPPSLPDKLPLSPKPPLLPKPPHLLQRSISASSFRQAKLKKKNESNTNNNVGETPARTGDVPSTLSSPEFNPVLSSSRSDSAVFQFFNDDKLTVNVINIEKETSTTDCLEPIKLEEKSLLNYDQPSLVNAFDSSVTPLPSCETTFETCSDISPNASFIFNKLKECDVNSVLLSANSSFVTSSASNVLPESIDLVQSRPSSYCDSISLDSESAEDTSVRKRISGWFGSFGRGGKGKSESFFYLGVSDSNHPQYSSTVSLEKENDSESNVSSKENVNNEFNLLENENDLDKVLPKDPEERKKRKAFLIAKELLTSEQTFIDVLKLIVNDFTSFIEQYAVAHNYAVIPRNILDKIVNPLPQLLALNEHLLADLESRINNWSDNPKISDVIVKKGPFLKLYTSYIKNFEEQMNFLDECCHKYQRFAKVLKDFENSERCKKLTLKHYMLKPVQRIPQYRLLLQDYISNLDVDSAEYSDTQTALSIIHDVLNHANSSIKQGDYSSKLLQIQSLLGNYEIIKPGREYIKEGELYKLSRKEMQLRYFILLTDCLLYTTYYTSMTGLRVKYELPLSGMKVYLQQVDPTEFSIITSTRSFTLRARSEGERTDWVNALQAAIKEKNMKQLSFLNSNLMAKSITAEPLKLGKEAPVWIQDKQTTMCQLCTAEFTVTFRRHHCRSCGKVVCSVCSNNKAPLQYLKFQSARVCEECHDFLLKEYENPATNMFERVKTELGLSDEECATTLENLKCMFKKFDNVKKTKKFIPQRLKEVSANDTGSSMSGWLHRKGRRGWKKLWFVLKDQVLYVYKASHDVVAHQSVPVLGYSIDFPVQTGCDEMDCNLVFKLTHAGQTPLVFSAPDKQTTEAWVSALKAATILK